MQNCIKIQAVLVLGPNLPKKTWQVSKISKIVVTITFSMFTSSWCKISSKSKHIKFWDQICPKSMSTVRNFKKSCRHHIRHVLLSDFAKFYQNPSTFGTKFAPKRRQVSKNFKNSCHHYIQNVLLSHCAIFQQNFNKTVFTSY